MFLKTSLFPLNHHTFRLLLFLSKELFNSSKSLNSFLLNFYDFSRSISSNFPYSSSSLYLLIFFIPPIPSLFLDRSIHFILLMFSFIIRNLSILLILLNPLLLSFSTLLFFNSFYSIVILSSPIPPFLPNSLLFFHLPIHPFLSLNLTLISASLSYSTF